MEKQREEEETNLRSRTLQKKKVKDYQQESKQSLNVRGGEEDQQKFELNDNE